MGLLNDIQNALGQGLSGLTQGKSAEGLSALFGPAVLGGLAGALLTSKAARGIAGGALLAGGGAALWNMYKDRMQVAGTNVPAYTGADRSGSNLDERAARVVRALVFAAKSDGHIDDKERQAIESKLGQLGIGSDAERLVQEALAEPLEPARIASGVKSAEEALEIYAVSCAAIDIDHFMERSYLDALAQALHIPEDVKRDIESKLRAPA